MKKGLFISSIKWIGLIFLFMIIIFLLLRLFMSRETDDVNPYMGCGAEELNSADVFYVVPMYNDIPINESREWCDSILKMKKKLCLHGVRHSYNEFSGEVSVEDLEYGINIFEDCFGYKPTCFKAPQLALSPGNFELVESYGMKVRGDLNQVFHKVYHCNDSGMLSNKLQRMI